MTPPAWSSFPATGLNFTPTKPSLMLVSFLMQTGKVAWPDCFNTFGLLGAEASFSTDHFAVPLPVCVAVQPGGGGPDFISSKLTVSAMATAVAMVIAIIIKLNVFTSFPSGWYEAYGIGELTLSSPATKNPPLTACAKSLAEPRPQ